jgi:glutamine synthetase
MNFKALRTAIQRGEIDTVILAHPDLGGRLVGKRFTGKYFLEHVMDHGTHGCNYLLAVDIEMEPQEGFRVANWEQGFGDMAVRPDEESLRELSWQPGAALVLGDCVHGDGRPVAEAPRTVLIRQVLRLAEKKFTAAMASELEFFLYNTTYHDAWTSGYRTLPPSSDYRIDYHTMQPARDEGLMRSIRNAMDIARVPIESSKGEWGRGQHEINFVYAEALEMADMHVVFKQGVKEIVADAGRAVTFMAKPSMSEPGSSCHIHSSLWRAGQNAFWDTKRRAPSKLFRQFLGGLLKYSQEFCLFFAPTVNSYKRGRTTIAPWVSAWWGKEIPSASRTGCRERTRIPTSHSPRPSRRVSRAWRRISTAATPTRATPTRMRNFRRCRPPLNRQRRAFARASWRVTRSAMKSWISTRITPRWNAAPLPTA